MKSNRITSAGHSSNTIVSRSQFKPIPFSTPMVEAIIAGRKTQTRRIVKQAVGWDINWKVMPIKEEHVDGIQRYEIRCGTQYHLPWFKAKFEVGDILWVRETFAEWDNGGYAYKADGFIERYGAWERDTPKKFHDVERVERWKPSLFMPKEACRLFLEVTEIKPQRLNDISQEDAKAEGVFPAPHRCPGWVNELKSFADCYKCSFKLLWNKINGKSGHQWDKNEWLWVISFKVVECPQGFC